MQLPESASIHQPSRSAQLSLSSFYALHPTYPKVQLPRMATARDGQLQVQTNMHQWNDAYDACI
jgi:hypothetical protein